MAKRFCVLPLGFSSACAANCERRHVHKSLREVRELEATGEIQFLDLHPATNKPRYVFRTHDTQHVHIPASVIEAAAGAYRRDRREISTAKNKVSAYGADNREFSRLIPSRRTIELNLKWNDSGFVAHFPSDGEPSARAFEQARGEIVRVSFKPRSPEAREVVLRYRQAERGAASLFPKVARKSKQREWGIALQQLDRWWPEIIDRFHAGPYSSPLADTKPSELPSSIVRQVVDAYLEDRAE
ncbi:MAG: hypothetical protein ACRD8A_14650 [Candidatus Acidiferrales bacterium]